MLTLEKSEAPAIPPKTDTKKKPLSDKKLAANKLNAKKSPGPSDTSKTRFNALKHGLRATGFCMLDSSPECKELLQELIEELKPVTLSDTAFVESIAGELIRMQRSNQLEADDIDDSLKYPDPPALYEGIVRPRLAPADAERLVRIHQRYRTTAFNSYRRMLQEYERRQRIRRQTEQKPELASQK
jgi:hypothetical protein